MTADETDLNRLAAVLRSDAPESAKLLACKRLAWLGNAESVAAVAPLLADAKLSHAARLALEAIPAPAAADALREALGRLKGLPLAGVASSLGVRRDAKSIPALARLLDDRDAEVAAAAAGALGKIATGEAAAILAAGLPKAVPTRRTAVADACLECAERLHAAGQSPQAVPLFDLVAKSDLPGRIRAAAVRGAMLSDAPASGARLSAALESADKHVFAIALIVARELPKAGLAPVLVAQLPKLTAERQALVLGVLGDLADPAARPAVVEAVGSGDRALRVAALRALATLGDAGNVGLLLAAAASQGDQEVAEAALDSLTVLPGIDAAVTDALGSAAGRSRLVLMELVGRRHISAARPVLLKSMESPDAATRLAALTALGGIIAPADFSSLTGRLLASGSAEEQAAAKRALKAACSRRPDKQACAESLVACLAGATPEASCFLLELLATVGDATALKAVSAAALSPNEEIQDTATRVLGDWRTPDVAPALADLARRMANDKFRVRALRGYIRVARQMDVPAGRRVAICREAMALAQRDEERRLALEAVGRCAAPEALKFAVGYLSSESLRAAAAGAAVSIGEKLAASQPEQVRAAMHAVLKATTDPTLTRRAKDVLAGKVARGW